jgi:hypothetical protein
MSEPSTGTALLLGPRAEVPPPWLEAHGATLLAALGLSLCLGWILWRTVRRKRRPEDPAQIFLKALAAAEAAPDAALKSSLATAALRAYLAAVCAEAPAGLSTQQLAASCERSALLATAADPILRALREADGAKFAGSDVDGDRVAELCAEAFARTDLARRALWKEALR